MLQKIYPRSKDKETVYLKSVITNPNIIVGDYTMYNDFVKEPKDFEKNNVLYQYPINQDKLIIGKFCSNLSEQKTISTIQERCITFNNDGSFVEEIRLDVDIILTGKYLFSDNLIALTYDDEKNETSILKIIQISDKKIVFKYLSKDRSSKRIILYKSIQ